MSQSLSYIVLHIIFSTKNRVSLIDEMIEPELYSYIRALSGSIGCNVHNIGGTGDHIHILLTLKRVLSMSDLLESLKKKSSKWIKTKGVKYLNFSWQRGFGVFSVSASQLNSVMKYISNQKQNHLKMSFQNEYRKILRLHNVDYDERYVWD